MLVVVLLITIVGSILITWLLPVAIKSAPPYGLAVDVIAGTVAAIAWAWLAYEVLSPLIGLTGWLRLVGSAGDAIGFAAVMLWVLRRIKR
jgi:hypothetical protein